MTAITQSIAVPDWQQREALLILSVRCGASAEHFAVAAQAANDFELRAFLSNCSKNRNIMADALFTAASQMPAEDSENVPVPIPNSGDSSEIDLPEHEDSALLSACLSQEEILADEFQKRLELPLSPQPDAVVRKCFAEVVATRERMKSLQQCM